MTKKPESKKKEPEEQKEKTSSKIQSYSLTKVVKRKEKLKCKKENIKQTTLDYRG